MRRSRSGIELLATLAAAVVLGCAYQGPTTTSRAPPPSNANVTHRELQDVELTASVQPTKKSGPVRLPVKIQLVNHSDKPIRLREENFKLVSADGSLHDVSRTQTADAGQCQGGWSGCCSPASSSPGWSPSNDVDPLAEQLTLDAFYTDVETGDRGPELAVPVKTRPDAWRPSETTPAPLRSSASVEEVPDEGHRSLAAEQRVGEALGGAPEPRVGRFAGLECFGPGDE